MPAILSHYLAGHCVDEPNQIVYVLAGAHDRTINNYEVYEVSELILVIFVIIISCQMKKSEIFILPTKITFYLQNYVGQERLHLMGRLAQK